MAAREQAAITEERSKAAEIKAAVAQEQAVSAKENAKAAESRAAIADQRAMSANESAKVAETKAAAAEEQARSANERAKVVESIAKESTEAANTRAAVADQRALSATESAKAAETRAATAEARWAPICHQPIHNTVRRKQSTFITPCPMHLRIISVKGLTASNSALTARLATTEAEMQQLRSMISANSNPAPAGVMDHPVGIGSALERDVQEMVCPSLLTVPRTHVAANISVALLATLPGGQDRRDRQGRSRRRHGCRAIRRLCVA